MRPVAWSLVALGLSAVAHADTVESDERGATLAIESYRVEGEFTDGAVRLRVRYDVVNRSRFADRARLQLELPSSAVVVGLRQRVGGAWLRGRLLTAEAAADRYDAYLHTPFVAARGAALLTGGSGHHDLALSYVPARGRVGVEYDAVVPACYAAGRWWSPFPELDAAPTLTAIGGTVVAAREVATRLRQPLADACGGFGDGVAYDGDRVMSWPGGASGVISRHTAIRAGGELVTVAELAAARTLEAAPVRPTVVFVLDASKSQGEGGVRSQVALIRGYLRHAADARVEIVVVRRAAVRLFGALVTASDALARLDALPPSALAVSNGSHLDAGLGLAASILAASPGPRRLVAMTDDRLRPSLTDAALRAAPAKLPADAIVHVVVPDDRGAVVDRRWDDRLAEVAGAWGGIAAAVGVVGDPAPLVELVRPIRVQGLTLGDEELEDVLEGEGLRRTVVATTAPALTGWIWGRRFAATVADRPVDRIRAATLALALANLTEDAVVALAGLASAVTSVTSLLADDPRWTPGGLPEHELGMSGGSSYSSACGIPIGLGHYGTIGHGSGTGTGLPQEVPELAPLLAGRVNGCTAGLGAWAIDVDVATTGIEVVDVAVTTTGVADAAVRDRVTACVTEAAWDLDLDAPFARYERSYQARFTP